MRWLGTLILALVACGVARAQQYTSNFENPPYIATPAGVQLSGQDNWINPVAGSAHYTVHPYLPNVYNFPSNPTGSNQFTAGASNGGMAVARAQHAVNFVSNDTWTTTWDMAAKYLGSPPASNNLGSFSLQDSSAARSFSALATWTDVNSPSNWQAGFLVYDAAGVAVPAPGLFPGPQWQNLQVNRWYRFSATFSFSLNRILEVSITDLTTLATTRVQPAGWFMLGGAAPVQPLPTAIRLFTGGNTPGNVIGWDNIDVSPFQVSGFGPPQGQEGTVVQITGRGFGTDPNDLSVAVMQVPGGGVPLTVLSTTDTVVTARLGPVRSGAGPGQIVVTRGMGTAKLIVPTLDDVIPEDPLGTLVWDRLSDPRRAASTGQFLPLFSPPPPGTQWFFGQNAGGLMRVTVSGFVRPNTTIRVIAKLHNQPQAVGSDVEATSIRLRVGGDAQYLAERVRDVILSAFGAHGINTTCVITNVGLNLRQIELTLRDNAGAMVPVDLGTLDVQTQDPIMILPFAIGPVTAFYHAGLTDLAGTALVSPVDLSGNDGATISPTIPVSGGLRVDTDLIALSVPNSSFTTRAWGVLAGQPNQLIGTARLQRVGSFFDVFADFAPLGATQVRIDVYYNTLLKATAIVPAGSVGLVQAGTLGLPRITGCGGRPTQVPNNPFLWIDFDRPCMITPSGGSPVTGNQIRVTAGAGAGNVQNFQAFDVAAGLDSPLDLGAFKLFSSVEGGVCYANCDGSTTPPVLNVQDFSCFLNSFAAGNLSANCDGSETPPQLNVLDFSCYLNAFAAGCP